MRVYVCIRIHSTLSAMPSFFLHSLPPSSPPSYVYLFCNNDDHIFIFEHINTPPDDCDLPVGICRRICMYMHNMATIIMYLLSTIMHVDRNM